jgi:hypothetical protein
MTSRPALLLWVAGLALVGLLAASVTAVVQARQAAAEQERAARLEAQMKELEAEVAALEAELASRGTGLDGLLDGLLGGDGDLGGLLDGFLGGGELDGLLGRDGDLDGLLDGLLGGEGGLDGLLGGVGGGIPGAACLTPSDGGGGIGDLFGEGGLEGLLGGGGNDTPDDPDALVETISRQVEELRELTFVEDVSVDFLDDAQLTAELEAILDEDLDPDELAAQEAILTALRALPADADLEALNRELLDGQVAGFYEPDTGRLVVRVPDGGAVRALDRVTLAHELDHALVDQVVGLPDLADGTDADAALGRLAVVEGDATLLMNQWTLDHLSLTDQLGMAVDGDLTGQQAQLEAIPFHLQRELLFPYTVGLDLICDVWLQGGWDAVDAAYADPPTTSAEAMWPERLGDGAADAPALTAPQGAALRHDDTFGAAPLSWLFEAPGGDPERALEDPHERAAAWAAGEVRLWDLDGAPVVGVSFRDRDAGDPALCASVTAWYTAAAPGAERTDDGEVVRFTGDEDVAAIACSGDEVRIAVAADAATATDVVS